ncbi:MAG: EAL domain-containing protein [Pseudolabrys sp.]|nr:EAL domain-containing protein [Pseudolabrys sp.]
MFFQIYNCLTVDHDWRLVALAVAVCLLSSAVAISLFHRALAATGRTRLIWIGLDAACAGCGIWATHFIAMLSYVPAGETTYNLGLTLLSLLIAMLMTGAGFGLALFTHSRLMAAAGGAIVGTGIAAMHYTGMMALEVSGSIGWTPGLVMASLVFGVSFGIGAMLCATRGDSWLSTSIAAGLLTVAIITMHFTGMTAVELLPDPSKAPALSSLSTGLFSLVVAGATVLILGMCLVAALADRSWKGTVVQQKMLLATALQNMSQGLCMFDKNGRVTLSNENYARMTGLKNSQILGRSLLSLLQEREASGHFLSDPMMQFEDIMTSMRRGEMDSRNVEVGKRTLRVVEVPMQEGGWIATFEDVTEWLIAQERMSHMAHHDALTDLANRTQLIEKLDASLSAIADTGNNMALHFIDLDRFKSVNDTFGHDGGDFLLKTVAERLRAATRPRDIVARLGGDEFVVVQTNVKSKEAAEKFAQRLSYSILSPIDWNGQTIAASISVGVALAPADAETSEQLLKCADLAMYKAKGDGRNRIRFFEEAMDTELQTRTHVERILRAAIENEEFDVHYQPIVAVADKRILGFEALVRMRGEDGVLIAPLEFIPLAEELRLIDKIGACVLREACRTAASWPEDVKVAVNLSPSQFTAGDIGEIVDGALRASGLAPSRLELEITESLLLDEETSTMAQLKALKAMGVAIVMDDFGTGYSSLSYLWKFPFDKIKIDRSFMEGFNGFGSNAETVIKTILALGRELRMRVTVEGIENASQADFLKDAEGDQAQGYFFGPPMPASEIAASLLTNFQGQRRAPQREDEPKSSAA